MLDTLVHVLGQIAYKKGCLETVVSHLKEWENEELVANADVHDRYSDFAAVSQADAEKYINQRYPLQ